MISLLANAALLKRFLSYVGLIPLILRYIEIAEQLGNDTFEQTGVKMPGPQKRELVIDATTATIQELSRRGYLPEELSDGLKKTAGELTDAAVAVYNTVGFFRKRNGHAARGSVSD